MCISPSRVYPERLSHREQKWVEVPCRKCWACTQDKINDLVGRCLCEADYSDHVWHVTFTYDDKRLDDPQQSKVVRKSDFQDFCHRMRHLFQMRYLVVSETGKKSTKRVHFHALLFFRGTPPQWEHNKRHWDLNLWPWGHIWVDPVVSETSMRYVVKYALKDVQNEDSWLSYSRIPIMGVDHARYYGERYARERLIPRNFKYRPPGAHDGRVYQFKGESRFIMLDALFENWPEAIKKPMSEHMSNTVRAYIKDRARKWYEKRCPTYKLVQTALDLQPRGFKKTLTDYHKFQYLWENHLMEVEQNHGKKARQEAEQGRGSYLR